MALFWEVRYLRAFLGHALGWSRPEIDALSWPEAVADFYEAKRIVG